MDGTRLQTNSSDDFSGVNPHRSASDDHGQRLSPLWYAVALLCLANMFSYMDRTALSVLMPLIKRDLDLTDSQLGLLVGFAFFLFYAACGIPIARFADRSVRKNVIAVSLVVWSVMTALSGMSQNFWHLLLTRMGLGAGEAGCNPAAISLITDYAPRTKQPGVFALLALGMFLGSTLGLIFGGWLGVSIGWRLTFVVLAIPGILLAIIIAVTLHEPTRTGAPEQPTPSFSVMFRTLLSNRTYRWIVVYYTANGFGTISLIQWLPTFYSRVHLMGLGHVGLYLGIATGAGATLGTLFGGFGLGRFGGADAVRPLTLCGIMVALALPAGIVLLLIDSPSASILLVFIACLLWSTPPGPVQTAMMTVAPPSMRATAAAICTFVLSLLGFGLGPFCVGLTSDLLHPLVGNAALRYALLVPALMLALASFALFRCASAFRSELAEAPSGL